MIITCHTIALESRYTKSQNRNDQSDGTYVHLINNQVKKYTALQSVKSAMRGRYKSYEKRKGHLDWGTLRLRTEQELARGRV